MLGFALFLLAVSLFISVFSWARGRPRSWVFPSDTFFLMSVILVGIMPFINTRAQSEFSPAFNYSDDVVARTLFAISIMFFVFAAVWSLRPRLRFDIRSIGVDNTSSAAKISIVIVTVVIALILMLFPRYIQYKIDVVRVLTMSVSGGEYQQLKRITYASDPLIAEVVGRLRYSVFALLFTMTAVYCFQHLRAAFYVPALTAAFIVLPASVSKLTVVVYLAYVCIAFLLSRGKYKLFASQVFMITWGVALVGVVILLAGVYFVQYPENFTSLEDVPRALMLAIFRVYLAAYGALLQYFTVYPDVFDHSYFRESTIIAGLLGEAPRNLDAEVPSYFLGESQGRLTTFPTIFIGGAYATMGYFGVAMYSLIVAAVAFFSDYVFVKLRSNFVRISYYSTMLINIIYFCILSAPTTLLTYGCAVIPAMALILDRTLFAPVSTGVGAGGHRFGSFPKRRFHANR